MTHPIRPATADDAPAIVALLGDYTSANLSTSASVALSLADVSCALQGVTGDPRFLILMHVRNGQPATGMVVLVFVPQLHHGGRPAALIDLLVVTAAVRRQGIGRSLVVAAAEAARAGGAYRCYAVGAQTNTAARALYPSAGLTNSGTYFERYLD